MISTDTQNYLRDNIRHNSLTVVESLERLAKAARVRIESAKTDDVLMKLPDDIMHDLLWIVANGNAKIASANESARVLARASAQEKS